MDRVARLIVAFVIGCAFAYAAIVPAYAQSIPATRESSSPSSGRQYVQNGYTQACVANAATDQAACVDGSFGAFAQAWGNWAFGGGFTASGPGAINQFGSCATTNGVLNGASYNPSFNQTQVCATACPSGQTLEGGTCYGPYTCPSGYTLAGTTCIADVSCPPAGTGGTHNGTESSVQFPNVTRSQWEGLPRETNGDGCNGVCGYRFRRTAWIAGTMFVDAISTGQACTGVSAPSWPQASPPTTPETTPNEAADCIRAGGSPGTVGGQFRCIDRRSTPDSTTTGTPTTSTTTRTNPDGSTTTTTTTQTPTTSCANGVCTTTTETTTTTTTVPAGGGPGTTTTETRSTTGSGTGAGGPGGNCDPATQQCGTESTFGGSCAAGFVCNGDAVQCAMAREQYLRNCQTLEPSTATTTGAADQYVRDVAAGKGLPADFMPRETKALSTINTGERFSAGSCPAPVTTNTPLGAFTIDFAPYCPFLSYFGLVILGAALLIAARIGVGGL